MAPNTNATCAVEKPAIQQLLDGIEKTLYEARAQAERVEAGINRIKCEPKSADEGPRGLGDAPRPVSTVEARLRDICELANKLLLQLGEASHRLDKAV